MREGTSACSSSCKSISRLFDRLAVLHGIVMARCWLIIPLPTIVPVKTISAYPIYGEVAWALKSLSSSNVVGPWPSLGLCHT